MILVADPQVNTLIEYRYKRKFKAGDGGAGAGGNRTGAAGKAVEIKVPVGTRVFDAETGQLLCDMATPGERYVACKGGRAGRGNLRFVTSVRQAPTFAEKGEPGEARTLRLELSLVADVGLVGLPNAGKSTLISAVSAAKPKVADYPFTTLEPNLGIVRVGERSFVVADLPGLIEGASEGKGVGHRFLRHAERTRVILHVVECEPLDGTDPVRNLELVKRELALYSRKLAEKPCIVALTKIDLMEDFSERRRLLGRFGAGGDEVYAVSAVTGEGVQALLFRLAELVFETPREGLAPVIEPRSVDVPRRDWHIERHNGILQVVGKEIERVVAMTDLDNSEAVELLQRRLKKEGVFEALKLAGATDGDTICIGEFEFTYLEET